MTTTLGFVWRSRRHVRSFDDVTLLGRAAIVYLAMPLLLRLEWSRLLAVLDTLSDLVSVPPGRRADRMDFYIRACGGVRRGPFQDNCVARSLVRFTLLNHPDRQLDVRIGVRVDGTGAGGPTLGRRHVWLTTPDGQPFLETEPVDGYVVQHRHRQRPVPVDAVPTGFARFVMLLGASGLSSATAGAASVARTKIVAVSLGPAGLALMNQMTSAVNALAWLSIFGASGTARLVAEALARGETAAAATVVRTTVVVLAAAVTVVLAVGLAGADLLALAIFGDRTSATWVWWLILTAPATAVGAVASAVLRGAQQMGRLAMARFVASVASVIAAWIIVATAGLSIVVAVPVTLVVAFAIATGVAAWPVVRPWLLAGGVWIDRRVARAVMAYSLATLVMGLATAVAFLAIGRHYLAAGDLDTAGRIAALMWLSEPLAAAFTAGHQASTYPAYAAAAGARAAGVLTRGVRGLVLLAVPALVLVSLVAGPLVRLALSATFIDIASLVPIVALATYVRSVNIVVGLPLLARGRLTVLTAVHLVWAALLAGVAIGGASPGLAGAAAFAAGCLVAAVAHFVVLLVVLRRAHMSPAPADLVWIGAGAAPLALLSVLP